MANDISLAVGDGARCMTYAELAEAKGTSLPSARQLVRRHRWPKQIDNQGYVKVTVPLAALTDTQDRDTRSDRGALPADTRSKRLRTKDTSDTASGSSEAVSEVLSHAVDLLCDELTRAHDRAARAEQKLEDAKRRIEELRMALTDAVEAVRIRTDVAAAWRYEVDLLRAARRSWWRRWFR
jgi:hypothetical protein